jgi:hypothetical protein
LKLQRSIASSDWYAEFCEAYRHPTPGIRPNMRNTTGLGYAGGVTQEEGLKKALDEIAGKIGAICFDGSRLCATA